MYSEIEPGIGQEVEGHGDRECWMYMLSSLAGVPFFLKGYLPVMLLLVSSNVRSDTESETGSRSVATRLADSILWDWAILLPYACGMVCGLIANAILADRLGRKTVMVWSSWIFSFLLIMMLVAPDWLLPSEQECLLPPKQSQLTRDGCPSWKDSDLVTEFHSSFARQTTSSVVCMLSLGILSNVLLFSSLMYITETSHPSRRGEELSRVVRQFLYGVAAACIIMGFIVHNTDSLSTSSSKAQNREYLRFSLALLLFLTLAAGIGLLAYPESPFWLIERRKPADCISSLQKLRQSNIVGAEYGAIYHCASDEARREAGWRALATEWPLRYLVSVGTVIQCVSMLGGMWLLVAQSQFILQVYGLQEQVETIKTNCSMHTCNEYVYPLPNEHSSTYFFKQHVDVDDTQRERNFLSWISLSDVGLAAIFVACMLGAYAGIFSSTKLNILVMYS